MRRKISTQRARPLPRGDPRIKLCEEQIFHRCARSLRRHRFSELRSRSELSVDVVLPLWVFREGTLNRSALRWIKGAERVGGGEISKLVLGHAVTPNSARSFASPSRMRVLMVPSGTPVSAAISL